MTETRAIIDDRVNRIGWTFADAATAIGISVPTLRKKCDSPKLFTCAELHNAFRELKLTQDQQETILSEALSRR